MAREVKFMKAFGFSHEPRRSWKSRAGEPQDFLQDLRKGAPKPVSFDTLERYFGNTLGKGKPVKLHAFGRLCGTRLPHRSLNCTFASSLTKLLLIDHWIPNSNNKLDLRQCSRRRRGRRSMDILPAKLDASSISASIRQLGSLGGLQRIAHLTPKMLPLSPQRPSYKLMHRCSACGCASNQSEGLYFRIYGLQ